MALGTNGWLVLAWFHPGEKSGPMAKRDGNKGASSVGPRKRGDRLDQHRRLGDVAGNADLRMAAETKLSIAWTIFLDRDLQSITIVDELGRPMGTLLRRDLADAVLDDAPTVPGILLEELGSSTDSVGGRRSSRWRNEEAAVEEVMRASVNTLPSTASLEDAASVFEVASLSEVVVVDDAGRMVGVVAAEDLIPFLPAATPPRPRWRPGASSERSVHRR
jgi:CBS-domain-containing membrane protein